MAAVSVSYNPTHPIPPNYSSGLATPPMSGHESKTQVVHHIQRLVVNPVGRQLSVTMLETTGRKDGQPQRNAVGGRVVDNQFWMVSEHGGYSDYVRNIKANPAVRVRSRSMAYRNRSPVA